MYRLIRDFVRRKRIEKYASSVESGLVPMSDIRSVNVVIDVEEPGFDVLKEDILAWGRTSGLKVNIYFFDFRRLGKDELLLTSITNTLLKKELDWVGTPDLGKISPLLDETSDLFISMIDNGDFPIDFLTRCAKARFKIGRHAYEGHPFNMILSGGETADLRSDARKIFAAITEFITKIR
ncbi:MAG: hypothetical protein J6R15_06200 [Bacteroidales bacterium]|jgi:hypothetical protein|nr:hypothetical protein [Bacteroidales bacterium]